MKFCLIKDCGDVARRGSELCRRHHRKFRQPAAKLDRCACGINKHQIGADADGNPINSLHISTDALFKVRGDVRQDGPS